jgi:CBS domain-containing protein
MKVSEIMTKNPGCCRATASLNDVAQMMADLDCGCIPVIEDGENKRPIGTITDRDITIRTLCYGKNPLETVAGEIMTDHPVTVGEEASIEECFRAMEMNKIRRILVLKSNGDCAGIVAQADVARKANEHETAELVRVVSVSSAAG